MISRIKQFLRKFDIYQLLALPVLVIVIFSAIDFKTSEIVVGVILPLSKHQGIRVINQKNGLMLAAKHINRLGGINGRKILLKIVDNEGCPERTAEMMRDLIYENEVAAVIGGIKPDETRVIQTMAEQAQVPFLTPFCTHFEITANDARFTFRSITDDQKQFEALAEFAAKRFACRKPAIIYDHDLYGTESAQRFIENSGRHGQQVCAAVSYNSGNMNFRQQIESIQSANPDSVFILAPPADSAIILRHLREARFSRPVFGGNAMATSDFIEAAGVYSEGVVVTLPFNARLGGQRSEYFLTEYYETSRLQADADAALAYESLMILALALKSSTADRLSIATSLAALHGWESITGSGGFDANGNQVRPAEIAIIKERQKIPANLEEFF